MDIRYPATLTPEPDGGFVVQFIDFDEAFTEGDTLEEALFKAAEVLTLTLDGRMEEGQPIPAPSPAPDAQLIAPSARARPPCWCAGRAGNDWQQRARGKRVVRSVGRAVLIVIAAKAICHCPAHRNGGTAIAFRPTRAMHQPSS